MCQVVRMTDHEFEQQAGRLWQKAFESSCRQGATADEAKDIAQDVMLRLWQMRSELERYRSLEAVSCQAARRLTINQHRRPTLVRFDQQEPCAIHAADPSLALEEDEDAQWLEHRLAELPPTQHAILHLRQVEHRSSAEIARLLGITETSVRTLLARARRTLLQEIMKRNQPGNCSKKGE